MANLDILRAALNAAIYQNYNHEISGSTLNTILNSMVDAIGGGYQFRGVATPETNPGTPDPNVFYIAAQVGTYSNFGLSVGENEVALFLWDGSWRKQNTGAASAEVVSQLGQEVGVIDFQTLVDSKYINIENGSIGATGENEANAKRLRITDAVPIANVLSMTVPDGFLIQAVFYYSAWTDATHYTFSTFVSVGARTAIFDTSYNYARPVFRNSAGTNVTANDLISVLNLVTPRLDNSINAIVGELSSKSIGDNALSSIGNTNFLRRISFEESHIDGDSVYCYFQQISLYKNSNSPINVSFASFVSSLGKTTIPVAPQGLKNCVEIETMKKVIFNTTNNSFALKDNSVALQPNEVLFFSVKDGRVIKFGEDFLAHSISHLDEKSTALLSASNGKITQWRNGTFTNAGNANCVTSAFIPIPHKQKLSIKISRPNTPGYQYVYGIVLTTSLQEIGNYPTSTSMVSGVATTIAAISTTSFANEITLTQAQLDSHYTGAMVIIGESDGQNWHPLRVADMDGTNVFLECSDAPIAINSVVERNTDKIPMLVNACRYHKYSNTSKDYQFLICTDMHADYDANKNAIDAVNGFLSIDAYFNCGDIVGGYYVPEQVQAFQNQLTKLSKPGYIVCGNHDVGNCFFVGFACNHTQAYMAFIKPMVDKGWISNGEYEVNKPYWYHDNAIYKIRLIGLYEYDDNLDLNETYWKAIPYNNALPNIAFNTAYSTGAQVNVDGYSTYSFEAVQNVTTPANYYTNPQYLPSYRVKRGDRVIRETQAQWFLDTLASTPQNYGVIVIMHNPFSLNAISLDKKFSWPAGAIGADYSQNDMQTDFIRNAIVAFMNGSNYSEKVVMSGNASYLNVLNDGAINYAYEVSKNFANKNSGAFLLGIVGGHSHEDFIWKDATEEVYQIAPNCARVDGVNDRNGDVRRTNTDGIARDSLTVVSYAENRIALVKIGVNVTERGTFRDYEVIEINP